MASATGPAPPVADGNDNGLWPQLFSKALLFVLVLCLAGSIDYSFARGRVQRVAVGTAVAMTLQFGVLPFLGYLTVKAFALDQLHGIMLQIVTCSPGGAYSNWWCSLLNADMLLSVSATTASTVVAAVLMPANLALYLTAAYDVDVLDTVRWDQLLATVAVVVSAVLAGVVASTSLSRVAAEPRHPLVRRRFYLVGNAAGLTLIVYSMLFTSASEPIWDRQPAFYASNALPQLLALLVAWPMASLPCLHLTKPERSAAVVECLFQNIGIGTAMGLALFTGPERATAVGVPLYYGVVQVREPNLCP
jgi:predicted Na+-dependent transporter